MCPERNVIGIELALLVEAFQDLLWLRQSFDVGCIAVKEANERCDEEEMEKQMKEAMLGSTSVQIC